MHFRQHGLSARLDFSHTYPGMGWRDKYLAVVSATHSFANAWRENELHEHMSQGRGALVQANQRFGASTNDSHRALSCMHQPVQSKSLR